MFETKVNTLGEIKFTTFLGSGCEPCQQAVQDFLGERLSHISNVSYFNIGIYSYRSSETDIEVQSFDIEVLIFDVRILRYTDFVYPIQLSLRIGGLEYHSVTGPVGYPTVDNP